MRTFLWVLTGASGPGAPAPRAAEAKVSEKVIRAWRDAGAEVCWVATSGLWDDRPAPRCRVGFRFRGWVPGRFENLPSPGGPFNLAVSPPWPDDESEGGANEITDVGLKELAKFRNLRALEVSGKTVTDAGAAEVAKLTGLGQLDLSFTKIAAAGLKALAGLRSVTRLSLSRMDVTEEMFEQLAGFKGLTRLDLSFTSSPVTAGGLDRIAKLNGLKKLGFFNVNVSDAAAKELGRSKSLRSVDFLNTKVTKAGAEELRRLLPGCDTSVHTVDLTLPPLLEG